MMIVSTATRLVDLERARERLWGAKAIADFAGVSEATVYRWAAGDDCPISKPRGRYMAMRTELDRWLQNL
ncbi:MAG: helix-turn-helix domain-containing protein [Phreatobacter sp.]|uniref:helix-turn-helix domain-containing protein n=1 Tax=Phreatobacter sp. TaxID=1966341 RepID=UPI001A40F181|nr:helix-turn-helix domain-containing protein [Phreatobacter sp.]MBL8570952.1 helix-turn-helix domain-containing protein [Phreatobacter sp.]